MAFSTQSTISDGTLELLDISIEYFDRTEIAVLFDGIINVYPWAWVGSTEKKISFAPAVPTGVEVRIVRSTDMSEVRHMFTLGAQFTTESLDENLLQVLHIAQEARENATIEEVFHNLNMHGYKIINVGNGVDPQDAPNMQQMQVHDAQIVVYKDAAAASAVAAAASAVDAANSAASVDLPTAFAAERTAVATLTNKTLVSPALGTPTGGNLANCTFPTLNQNTSGTASNVTGTVATGNGGTGLTTPGTSGNVLTSNGGAWISSPVAAQVSYTAQQTPIPIGGGAIAHNHSLGAVPAHALIELVCLVADAGYSIGDVLTLTVLWNGSASVALHNVWRDATQVGTYIPSGYSPLIMNKSTGAVVTPTAASWAVRFNIRAG